MFTKVFTRRWLTVAPTALAAFVVLCTAADASVISSLVGDKDGFGLAGAPAVPADGTLWRDELGGVFFTDYRDAGDLANAPFTDIWTTDTPVSYVHNYSLDGPAVSALLQIQIAGIADNGRGPISVFFNGTEIGEIPDNVAQNSFQEVLTYNFAVSTGLLTESDAIMFTPVSDGYSINFSELTIITDTNNNNAVPEPASVVVFGLPLAFAGLLGWRRRRKMANQV